MRQAIVHLPPERSGPRAGRATLAAVVGLVVGYSIGSQYDAYVPARGLTGALIGLALATVVARMGHAVAQRGGWRIGVGWEKGVAAIRGYVGASGESPTGFWLSSGEQGWAVVTPADLRGSVLVAVKSAEEAAKMLAEVGARESRALRLPVRRRGWGALAEVGLGVSILALVAGDRLPRTVFESDALVPLTSLCLLPAISVLAILFRPFDDRVDLLEVDRGTASLIPGSPAARLGWRAYVSGVSAGKGTNAVLALRGADGGTFTGNVEVSFPGGSLERATQREVLFAAIEGVTTGQGSAASAAG